MLTRAYGNRPVERLLGIYNRQIELLAGLAMFILFIHWSLILWFVVSRLGTLEFLRLHYTATLGVDWVAVWWKIFIFPGAGLTVFIINGLLAGILAKNNRSLGFLLFSATIMLQIFFLISGVMALLLNG
jgi:sugar phosphate permease